MLSGAAHDIALQVWKGDSIEHRQGCGAHGSEWDTRYGEPRITSRTPTPWAVESFAMMRLATAPSVAIRWFAM